jgi:hypothetical protein
MSVKRYQDVDLNIHTALDLERCKAALLSGEAIVIGGHLGFIMRIRVGAQGDAVYANITLKHTGPQLCSCKFVRNIEDVQNDR